MRLLHTMLRVQNLDNALHFFVDCLELSLVKRTDYPEGRFTLVFLSAGEGQAEIELTHNWDEKTPYSTGRFFGHIAFEVENVYLVCEKLLKNGIEILRPPRDGRMAFIKSPDGHSIELLQKGTPLLPAEPWVTRPNIGQW
jgi:lactoylglutathione lyase